MIPRNSDVIVLALQECKTKMKDSWRDSVLKHLNRNQKNVVVDSKYKLLSMKSCGQFI